MDDDQDLRSSSEFISKLKKPWMNGAASATGSDNSFKLRSFSLDSTMDETGTGNGFMVDYIYDSYSSSEENIHEDEPMNTELQKLPAGFLDQNMSSDVHTQTQSSVPAASGLTLSTNFPSTIFTSVAGDGLSVRVLFHS